MARRGTGEKRLSAGLWLFRTGKELQECDFHFYVLEEKWNMRNKWWIDIWNLKLRRVPKIFENSLLTPNVNERPAYKHHLAMVTELHNLNDVSIFIWLVLFLLVGTTRLAWWPCSPGLGKNFLDIRETYSVL